MLSDGVASARGIALELARIRASRVRRGVAVAFHRAERARYGGLEPSGPSLEPGACLRPRLRLAPDYESERPAGGGVPASTASTAFRISFSLLSSIFPGSLSNSSFSSALAWAKTAL